MKFTRKAEADWNGSIKEGNGKVKLGSGAFEGAYSFQSRFSEDEDQKATNPEELIAAAHAGCFTMALSGNLGKAGYEPKNIHTTAKVKIEKEGEGFVIPNIDLETEAEVDGIKEDEFQKIAEETKKTCPVSQVLSGAEISLKATLK
ncbi:MAG: OsmC family protein [Acidobacteriota bacterium]|jgi:osmotically inducible protein OsmC|nr:OsmC family protein [Acidobacteriota bacterium]